MADTPLSHLVEHSVQIAWEFLERSGDLGDAAEASQFLSHKIEQMVRNADFTDREHRFRAIVSTEFRRS
ncbi:hypothetical protein JQ584_50495 [Bradyrhizobium liaoningense]|nr:hypothetical protein [Bradyrhizobium liaoningense]